MLPLQKNLIVRPYRRPEKSEGGIWLPDEYRDDKSGLLWDVLAVGPQCEECIQVDDILLLERAYVSQRLAIDDSDSELYSVSEDHVMATIS